MKLISFLRIVFLFIVFICGLLYWQSPYFLRATYNEFFIPWQFKMPPTSEPFLVQHVPPRAIQRVIRHAFSEYKVQFTNTPKTRPHLILKRYYEGTTGQETAPIPYIGYSGEYANMRWKRFHPSGYPFFEITSNEMKGDNFLFLPFIVYGKSNLRAFLTKAMAEKAKNKIRPTQVAYVSSHCIPVRDQMFSALKEKFGGSQAISYGKCQRTPGAHIPGTYHDLTPLYQKHNFVLAMENHDRPGYITEKIMNALEGGAVPLYWGDSQLAHKWFNSDAFIDLKQYKSLEAAAQGVYTLSQDPNTLERKLRAPLFKNNKIPPFLLLNDDTVTPAEAVILKTMGMKLRTAYNNYIQSRNRGKPYLKALAFKENIRTKIQHTWIGEKLYKR